MQTLGPNLAAFVLDFQAVQQLGQALGVIAVLSGARPQLLIGLFHAAADFLDNRHGYQSPVTEKLQPQKQ